MILLKIQIFLFILRYKMFKKMESFKNTTIQYSVNETFTDSPKLPLGSIAEKIFMEQGTAIASLMMRGLE